jgi:uncharacterized protein
LLIDINTYIGHWPFRQLRHNTASALVGQMDRHGIDVAVVGSIHGIFYKNAQAANQELAREVKRHGDRLLPFATLDPTYPGWREDLRHCAEDLGLRGLRLFPQYGEYSLADPAALELIDAATELGWCIQVPMRVVDRRQRHRWDLASDLTPADFEQAVTLRPAAKWMFLNTLGLKGQHLGQGTFVAEISRMTAVLQRNIQALAQSAGVQHLAFGTGMPFKMATPALLKLEILDLPARARERLAWRNAAGLLGIKG